ncbi:MAG: hypothetical protein ACFFBP_20360 [Promethearchaeota archaeon]
MTCINNVIVNIYYGRGHFTHAISREQITTEKGNVKDVIRLTRAIILIFKTK